MKSLSCATSRAASTHTRSPEISTSTKRRTPSRARSNENKQEHRLNTMLKEWGYIVDCETTINVKAGQCLTDTQRHFSRLDFRIINCVNAVECDEDQHFWYQLSCEMSVWQTFVRRLFLLDIRYLSTEFATPPQESITSAGNRSRCSESNARRR